MHHYIGETFGLLKLPNRAIASYERAANLPGGGPPTWMELASLFERAHRLDEAEELIERAVRSGFDLPLVSLVRGRIQRRQKRLEPAESTFRSLVEKSPDSEWSCQAWAEIALMKDAQDDYGSAVAAIENCKQLQRTHERPYWDASQKLHSRLMELNGALTKKPFATGAARPLI